LEVAITFAVAGAVILLGFIGEWIFEKTSIPDPIWLILFGVGIGQMYGLAGNQMILEVGVLFSTFALIFILFEGVMNTDLKNIFFGFMKGSGLAVIGFFCTVFATAVAMKLIGWGWLEGILLGVILGDSAQAVIIPIIKKINIGKESAAALTFESAMTDVLCIVGAVTLINMMRLQSFSITEISKSVLYSFSIAILLGIAFGFIWVNIHRSMNRFNKSYITTIAALLMIYSFVEYLGANGALACLAFGIIIANSREIFQFLKRNPEEGPSEGEKFFYSQISFFVTSFFFVYIGIMINLRQPALILVGFLLTILILISRPLAVRLSGISSKLSEKDRVFVEVLNPKGTSAAVLAQLPLQYGLSHGLEIATIVTSVITFSIFICIIFVFFTTRGIFHGFGSMLNLRSYFRK
jgi:potassium/hydrogen antiporter